MHKVYQKFTDKSNNEEGYELNQFNNRNNQSAFTLFSFEIADATNAVINGTYNRTSNISRPKLTQITPNLVGNLPTAQRKFFSNLTRHMMTTKHLLALGVLAQTMCWHIVTTGCGAMRPPKQLTM